MHGRVPVKSAMVLVGILGAAPILPADETTGPHTATAARRESRGPVELSEPRSFHLPGHMVISFAFDRAARRIIVGSGLYHEEQNQPEELRTDVTRGYLTLWDVGTGEEITRFAGDFPLPSALAFSSDGKTILSASVKPWEVNRAVELALWDVHTRVPVRKLLADGLESREITFSVDGRFVASRNSDQTVRVWDRANGEELAVLKRANNAQFSPENIRPDFYRMRFSHDGKALIVHWKHSTVDVFNVDTWERRTPFPEESFKISGIDLSPDGESLAVVGIPIGLDGKSQLAEGGGLARLRPLAGGRRRATWQVESLASDVTFSPDGKFLAFSGPVSTIWNLESQEVVAVIRRNALWTGDRIRFSPDGRWIAIGGFFGLHLWDVSTLGITGNNGDP